MGDTEMPATASSNSDDLEKRVSDIVRVEGSIVGVSMVALGFLVSAITSFNQTNIGLKQVGMIPKLCQYIPLAPTFQYFVLMVIFDVVCLSTGLFSIIITGRYAQWKYRLVVTSIACLILGLTFFVLAVWGLRNAFFYASC